MIIESKPMLLRDRLAYRVLLAKWENELESCFIISTHDATSQIQKLNEEISFCKLRIDAIDQELINKHQL